MSTIPQVQCCYAYPGSRRVIKTGHLSASSGDGIETVRARVALDSPRIGQMLHMGPITPRLMRPMHDLHVHVSYVWRPIAGGYQEGAMYVSMVALMLGRRARGDTLVFGHVDGKGVLVGGAWEWTARMVTFAAFCGYKRLVVGGGVRFEQGAREVAEKEVEEGQGARRPRLEIVECGREQGMVELLPLLLE